MKRKDYQVEFLTCGNLNEAVSCSLAERKVAVTNEIYATVKEQIITMKLLPGQLLMVQHLSDENGISRTPVREALVRLREENLLEDADGRKFRVTQITWKLIHDIYEARKATELYAVSKVAPSITKSQVNALRKLVQAMEHCAVQRNFQASFEYDMAFHNKILEIYGNQILISWMNRVRDHQQRIRYLAVGSDSRMANSLAEHREILEALAQHDPERAQNAMLQHLDRALQDMLELRNQGYFVAAQVIKDQ